MITGASTPGADWFLNGLENVRSKEAVTTRQISSGYRIESAADSPSQIVDLVGLNSSLARNTVAQANYTTIQAELQSADQVFTTGIPLLDSARTLGLQGANSTSTPESRQALATQVQGILQQFISLANTSVNGHYIFSGDSTGVPPYQADATSPVGYSYQGSAASTRQVLDASGGTIYTGSTAQQIFDHRDSSAQPDANNVLYGLQNLVQALQINTGIGAAITALESASSYLNQQQSAVGAALNNLTAAQQQADAQKTTLQTQISAIRDTDVAQAAIDLNMEKVAESAALAAQGGMSHKSLFDYMG